MWGTILALSVPVADDLGVYWGFLLIRATALLTALAMALSAGVVTSWTRDFWRVAAWGVGDSAAYLLFVAAAERGPAAVASVLAAQFATAAAPPPSGERPLPRQTADRARDRGRHRRRRARRIARSGLRVTVRGVRDAGLDGDTGADRPRALAHGAGRARPRAARRGPRLPRLLELAHHHLAPDRPVPGDGAQPGGRVLQRRGLRRSSRR